MSRPMSVRQKRIADQIQGEIGDILRTEMRDPRLGFVTVTKVNVDRELDYANVWVCAPDGDAAEPEIMDGLTHASGFLRRQLAQRLDFRKMPRLRFHWDYTPDHASRIDALLDELADHDDEGEAHHRNDD